MKVTLTFKLPEEKEEFVRADKGADYYNALWEFDQYLRKRLKYEELDDVRNKVLEEVREEFWNLTSGLLE